jgi:hypothetical protein
VEYARSRISSHRYDAPTEHNLAKVGVEGSNPFARSKTALILQRLRQAGRILLGRIRQNETQTSRLIRAKSGTLVRPAFARTAVARRGPSRLAATGRERSRQLSNGCGTQAHGKALTEPAWGTVIEAHSEEIGRKIRVNQLNLFTSSASGRPLRTSLKRPCRSSTGGTLDCR